MDCSADLQLSVNALVMGQGNILGNVAIGKLTTPTAKLDVVGTISGSVLIASSQLRSSGSLIVEGAVTLKSLTGCASLQSSSNGALSCATGLTQSSLDARYVNTSGDTMTGALTILKTAGTSTGNTLVVDTKGLVYDASNKRVGIGTAAPKATLDVLGTISGSALRINGDASFGYRGAGATGWLSLIDTGGGNGRLAFEGVGSVDSDSFLFRSKNTSLQYGAFTSAGNFILGAKSTATAKLDVVGTISGSALTISGLSGCESLKSSFC
jgi:hypothetical protein